MVCSCIIYPPLRFARLNLCSAGTHACLFFGSLYLIKKARSSAKEKLYRGLLILVLFTVGTIRIATSSTFSEMMYIDNRDFPGGPATWLRERFSIAVNVVTSTTYYEANFFADGILVRFYRFCEV